jgi:hypothetical protein
MPNRYEIARPVRIAGTLCVPGDLIVVADDGTFGLVRDLPPAAVLAALADEAITAPSVSASPSPSVQRTLRLA